MGNYQWSQIGQLHPGKEVAKRGPLTDSKTTSISQTVAWRDHILC